MDTTYEQQLQAQLTAAADRAAKGVAAANLMKMNEGKLIQDWINDRVSYELERMTGKNPLSDREYLEGHGAVRVLKEFNIMLQSAVQTGVSAQEEVKILNEQQSAANA
jgi:hypothetical protein